MTTDNDNQGSAYRRSVELLLNLHRLMKEGKGDSDEADEIRELSEEPWWQLTEAQKERIRTLSAELYTLEGDFAIQHPEVVQVDASAFWEQIQPLRREGRFREILRLLREKPECVAAQRATVLRAMCYEQLGELENALLFFEAAATFEKEGDTAKAHFLFKLHHFGYREQAFQLASTLSANPEELSIELCMLAGDILGILPSGRVEATSAATLKQAVNLFTSAVDKTSQLPESPQLRFWQVHCLKGAALCEYKLNQRAESVRYLDHALTVDAFDDEALTLRGLMCIPEQSNEALEYFNKAAIARSSLVWPYLFLARHALVTGRHDECLEWSVRALPTSMDPDILADLHECIAISLAQLGRPSEQVRETFRRALTLSPANERISYNFHVFEQTVDLAREIQRRWSLSKNVETDDVVASISGSFRPASAAATTSPGNSVESAPIGAN